MGKIWFGFNNLRKQKCNVNVKKPSNTVQLTKREENNFVYFLASTVL